MNELIITNLEKIISNEYIRIFIISMLPITELRFSIPYGIIFLNLDWKYTMISSIIGNISVGIIVLYLIGPFMSIPKTALHER